MSLLKELGESIGAVAAAAGGSVVRIGGGWRGGSGFVIEDGYVLTNAHNVRGETLPVAFADGRRAEARLAGMDLDGDLAVLALDTAGAAPLAWADEASLSIGTPVFGVAPNGNGPRVTFGYVSSVARAFRGPRGRRISGSLEHTAPLAPGSSGSPLVDGDGKLIGINTNRLGGGFYLALPADAALRDRVAALRRGESVERPRLGVGIAPAHAARRLRRAVGLPERDGLLVREVEEDSPADRAGIAVGDLLVDADGRTLRSADDLYDALGAADPGGTMSILVVRGTDERRADVTFGDDARSEGPTGTEGPVH